MAANPALIKDGIEFDLTLQSWHEASHSVVATYNLFSVYNIRVRQRDLDSKDGATDYYMPVNIINQELKKMVEIAYIQTMFAGIVGEKILYRELCGSTTLPKNLQQNLSYDRRQIREAISRNNFASPGKEAAQFKKNIQRKVEKILMEHWEAVKLIAHTLHKNRKIANSQEFRSLLLRKSDNKTYWKEKFSKIDIIYNSKDEEFPSEECIKNLLLNK